MEAVPDLMAVPAAVAVAVAPPNMVALVVAGVAVAPVHGAAKAARVAQAAAPNRLVRAE